MLIFVRFSQYFHHLIVFINRQFTADCQDIVVMKAYYQYLNSAQEYQAHRRT